MVSFNNPALNSKVTSFKSEFSGHEQLIRYGQFYLTERLTDELLATIQTSLETNPLLRLDPAFIPNAMSQFEEAFRQSLSSLRAAYFTSLIESLQLPADLKTLFTPTASAMADAQQMYNRIWGNPDIGSAPPWLGFEPTLDRIKAANAYEKDKCFPVLRALAAKLLRKRGVAALPSGVRISDGAIAGAILQGPAARGADPVPQQIVRYSNPTALGSVYAHMQATIDSRGLVQCGLLSGAAHEHSAFGSPEHYILAFAYERVGDLLTFLCWDPDANHSNIAETTWGRGFTCLFALPDHLSTAFDAADLTAIERRRLTSLFGDHVAHPRRHCYQAYSVQTLPL